MFEERVYTSRREALRKKCRKGILFLPGNNESPMNYKANTYSFRQDSNFLYFFGLNKPGLAAIIDMEEGKDVIYGDDPGIDDIIWIGETKSLKECASQCGVKKIKHFSKLKEDLEEARKSGKLIRILPPYRDEHLIFLSRLLGCDIEEVMKYVSQDCIRAVVSLREIKEECEIQQIEHAVDVAYRMHTTVMKMAFPGTWEREIAGKIEGIAIAEGGAVSFPVILSMNGETLHNHYHGNLLKEGRMVVTDAGCESPLMYASDITRTVPVGGKFTGKQKEIYQIVLEANVSTILNARSGISYFDLHMSAARIIAEGLKDIGLMRGDVESAVQKGAHALFFPHGLGHMLGLDVHDMESLGEDLVGYDETISRSKQFGTAYLRLAKLLKPGFVITVEPGIYFIPALIDLWEKEKRFNEFINYSMLNSYKNFGGIRIEDDILITQTGCRLLGKSIPKTISEIEDFMSEQGS